MLLNLNVKNAKSFKNETNFTLLSSTKTMHSDYLIETQYSSNKLKVLPITIIYGANASGKTNLVHIIKLLRNIVLSGNIDTDDIKESATLMPFLHDHSFYEPVELEIEFVHKNHLYTFGLILGNETRTKYRVFKEIDSIQEEWLKIDQMKIYHRQMNKIDIPFEKLMRAGYIESNPVSYYKTLKKSIESNQDDKQLFLSSGFKFMFNKNLYDNVIEWLENVNIIMNVSELKVEVNNKKLYSNIESELYEVKPRIEIDAINRIVNAAEFGNQKISFSRNDEGLLEMQSSYPLAHEHSDIMISSGTPSLIIKSDAIESKGTIHLLKLVQPFVKALKTGGNIILDEMDASLHFEVVVALIRVFNNQELNKKGAQLIFSTHNPVYFDGDLLRHDQINIVKKDPDTLVSELYDLSDFGLRPEEKLLKNYLNGKYGALLDMDLELAFKEILENSKE